MPLIHINALRAKDITDPLHHDPVRVYVRDPNQQWHIYRPTHCWTPANRKGYEVFDLNKDACSSHMSLAEAKKHIRQADALNPAHPFDFGNPYNLAFCQNRKETT